LGNSARGTFQVSLVFSSSIKPRAIVSRITGVDLRARGAGGPEGNPAELQARRRRSWRFSDQVEGELLGLLVAGPPPALRGRSTWRQPG